MHSNTKFFRQLQKLQVQIQHKWWVFKTIVIGSVFSLFLGFVFGNIFGTFLGFFRGFFKWDGFIIALTVLFIELLNYINYKKNRNTTTFKPREFLNSRNGKRGLTLNFPAQTLKVFVAEKNESFLGLKNRREAGNFNSKSQPSRGKTFSFQKLLNFYKMGLLLGLFIDAFKVGS